MKKVILCIFLWYAITLGGRLGIGIGVTTKYEENYLSQNYEELTKNYFSAEFRISAEGLPYMFIEPVGMIINDAMKKTLVPGLGLRLNVAPRLGKFFLGPFFGIEGDIIFYNQNLKFKEAIQTQRLEDYFEKSNPRAIGNGFGGISIYMGKSTSFDFQYRYLYLAKGIGVEMVGVNLTCYIDW
ncbi:MAG: hypothetical protein N3A65_03270 [candidate division WOR-3 bacterium]|nr:hypothetical protein [candidate division WOR-3 bacterium]